MSSALAEELIDTFASILIKDLFFSVREAWAPDNFDMSELILIPTLVLITTTLIPELRYPEIRLVLILAVLVAVMVTGFVPDVLQFVPEVPVCPVLDIVNV